MLSDDEAKLGKAQLKASLSEVSTNLTRALEVLEECAGGGFRAPGGPSALAGADSPRRTDRG
jgi:hypothetical protein